MGVEFIDIGDHKNIYSVRFDKGDIFYSIGGSDNGKVMLSFYTNDPDKPFKSEDFIDRDFNETPLPETALIFSDPLQINDLIQMLLKLQVKYFE